MQQAEDRHRDIVAVNLGRRAYDIHIGENLFQEAGRYIAPLLNRPFVAIVTDENVARHHLGTLEISLAAAGIKSVAIILPPGEKTKSFSALADLCEQLLAAGVERRDKIIAFGGGVIGDLTGFAAAILRRGVDFIQIPTTLLAQVDSSVGGKTGINSAQGKNLIGAFLQPVKVLADTSLLDTLPRRELAAGYAEVAKYGLLGDLPFFESLEALAGARVPLVTLEEKDAMNLHARRAALTEAGRDVLACRADHVRLNGIDCWRGGVHLTGQDRSPWRWDSDAETLVS